MGVEQAKAAIIRAGGIVTPAHHIMRHFDIRMPDGSHHPIASETRLIELAKTLEHKES